ncbi:putative MFS-type transporter C09D4.1-like isoform X5, partial [Dinothrombium tinctorium]
YTATNYYQHFEYATIADIIADYYNINIADVNWSALLYNIGCIVFLYPTLKCISRFGFHISLVSATTANAFGACIKLLALKLNLYALYLFGQIFPAFVALFPMSLPAILGANWFKSEHVAAVIGVNNAFTAFGCVVAFLFPSLIFDKLNSKHEVERALFYIAFTLAVITILILVLNTLIVKEKPKTPPSFAEQTRRESNVNNNDPITIVLRNKNYILLLIFSFVMSTSQVTTVVLEQVIAAQFAKSIAKRILTTAGVLSIISGIPGSLITGIICKRCKNYKWFLVILDVLVILFFSLYTLGLYLLNEIMIFVFIFLAAFVYNSQMVMVIDFIVEVTYPYPEATTLNIATGVGSIPGVAFVPMMSILIKKFDGTKANLIIISIAVINLILSLFVTNDLRRHHMNKKVSSIQIEMNQVKNCTKRASTI